MSKVVVLGFNGQLASELRAKKADDSSYVFWSKEDIAAARRDGLLQTLSALAPNFLINCAAYTAVDKAESERESCFDVNRDLVRELSIANRELGSHLIHYSTDYVFDGTSQRPYLESDPTRPINAYGESKLAGEREILEHAGSATIVRTSWVYSRFGHNFVKTMLRLASTMKTLRVVADQKGCPTWTGDVARVTTEHLLKKTGRVDLLNYSGGGVATWHQFAEAIFEVFGQEGISVTPIATAEFPTPAQRPLYSVLSKDKFEKLSGEPTRDWRLSLEACAKNWSN